MSLSMERRGERGNRGRCRQNKHKHKLTFMVALSEERRPPVNCVWGTRAWHEHKDGG